MNGMRIVLRIVLRIVQCLELGRDSDQERKFFSSVDGMELNQMPCDTIKIDAKNLFPIL